MPSLWIMMSFKSGIYDDKYILKLLLSHELSIFSEPFN